MAQQEVGGIAIAEKVSNGFSDGAIAPGSQFANILGFTPDKFTGYLWKHGNTIVISLITSNHPGAGNLSALFKKIESRGYKIQVPTPSTRMKSILDRWGYFETCVWDEEIQENVEVWHK